MVQRYDLVSVNIACELALEEGTGQLSTVLNNLLDYFAINTKLTRGFTLAHPVTKAGQANLFIFFHSMHLPAPVTKTKGSTVAVFYSAAIK